MPSTPTQPATAHTKYNFNGSLYLNPGANQSAKIANSAKYSREVCSNLVNESKASASASLYVKNYNKKQFASSEDLCSAAEQKSRKLTLLQYAPLAVSSLVESTVRSLVY